MQTDLHELDIRLSAILMAFVWIIKSISLNTMDDLFEATNAVNTDTNAKFCVFKSGTNIQIKNRLGATKIIKYELKY